MSTFLKQITVLLFLALWGSKVLAQGPVRFDCPQYPSYAFFDRSCLIKTAAPYTEIRLPQGGVDGLNEERPMHLSIPTNRPTWALGIAHAWNYNRNIIQRVDHPKISYWMAITGHETGMACDCGAQWPANRTPWNSLSPAFNAKCNEGLTQHDGCFQMEEANAWCGDLNQTWPWRFKPNEHQQFISTSHFSTACLGLAYRNILNHYLIDYAWGIDIWPIITATADPNAYEKLMASGWNSWAAAVQDNVTGTAGAGQGFNLYTPAGRAAAIASSNWDLTATSSRYPEVIGWTMNALEQNTTSTYYKYNNPIVTSTPAASQNHVDYGFYNVPITLADVNQYLSEIFLFYPELTSAQTAATTANVTAVFNSINGGAAVPFMQIGPVIDEIILGLPKEIPLMSVIHNDGLPAYNNGYRQCIGDYAPASHITTNSESDTICKGQSIVLEAMIDGGDGPNMTYTWYKDGIAVAGGNQKQLVITPTATGTFVYTVTVCNTDLGGCAPACCPKTIVVNNCNACGITATPTTVNTPCQNMHGGTINLTITGSTNYTVTYQSDEFGGSVTGNSSTKSITNLPDGVYNITIQDNVTATCKFKLSAEVKFTTPMNEKLTASIQSMTNCDAVLKTKLEQDDCECEWSVYFDTPYAAWERDVFVIITPSNGAAQRLRKDVLINAYPAPTKATFKMCTGEKIKFEVEVQPASGSCTGAAGYNQQNAPIEVYIKDKNGVKVLNQLIPIGSAQQYQNYTAFEYTVNCPYTPGNYTYVWNPGAITGTPANVAGNSPTIYTVTATNTANTQCSLTDTVYVPFHCTSCIPPKAVMSGTKSFCAGDSTQLSVALTGTKPFKIKLSNGSTKWTVANINANTYTFYAKKAGTYKVDSVWDATCDTTGEGNTVVTVNALPNVDLGVNKALCYGGSDSLKATGTFSSYLWTPTNKTTPSIFVNTDGQHVLEVTDAKGCKNRDTVLVSVNPEILVSFPTDTMLICAGSSATLKASIWGGYGGYIKFQWNGTDSGTTDSLVVNSRGWYKMTVYDGKMCFNSDSIFVDYSTSLPVELADTAICAGDSITITSNQNASGTTYLWNTGATTPSIKIKNAGIYGVVVHNAAGCSGSDSMTLTVNALPAVNLGVDKALCFGGSDSLKSSGTFASYLWTPTNKTTPSIFVNANVQHILEVTDAKGCKKSDTVLVNINPDIIVSFPTDTVSICAGTSTTLKPTISGGYGGFIRVWSGAGSGSADSLVASAQGWYKLNVFDGKMCTKSDSIYVKLRASDKVQLRDTNVCAGDSVEISINPASAGNTYLWNTSATTSSIKVNNAGIYGVVVQNASGCKSSDSMTLTLNPLPTVNLGADKVLCYGSSDSIKAAGIFTSYLWTPGNITTPSRFVNSNGQYILEATDAKGCKNSDTILVTINSTVNVSFPSDTVYICPGSSTTLKPIVSGGAGGFAYQWTGAATGSSDSLVATVPGWYKVKATDSKLCFSSDSIYLKENSSLVVQLNNATICAGDSLTLITAYSGSSYTYLWNTGATTPSIKVKNAGIYGLVVENGSGCKGSDSMTLNLNPLPVVSLGADKSICAGASYTINAGNFSSYLWSTNETAASITKNVAGTYSVKVTDNNGCVNRDTIILAIVALPAPDSIKNIDVCKGNTVVFNEGGYNNGNGPFTYKWNDNSTAASLTLTNVTANTTVFVDVTDKFGCTGRDSATVRILPNLPVQITGVPDSVMCAGESVVLSSQYSNGYNFSWSTGATTSSITVNSAQTVTLTVNDGKGCTGTDAMQIRVNPLPDMSLIPVTASICSGAEASLGHDYGDNYTYLWSNGSIRPIITSKTGATYTVKVTNNATGCFADTSVVVSVHSNPVITLGNDVDTCEGSNIIIKPQPQDANWTYAWSNNSTANQLAVNATGSYILTVVDQYTCSAKDTVNVNFKPYPVLDLLNGKDSVKICEGETLTLNAGNPGMSYLWNVLAKTPIIIVDNTGSYSVKVSNGNCAVFDTVYVKKVVVPKNVLSRFIDNMPASHCFDEDGDVTISLDSTSSLYSYLWNTGETTSSITVSKGGVYNVVLNEGTCAVSDEVKIVEYCPTTLYIPNAFTPNGDSKNNVFKAEGINVKDFELLIFNRWGEQIFRSADIDEGWDGKYLNQMVQQDVYVYKILYSVNSENGKLLRKERLGTVTVIY